MKNFCSLGSSTQLPLSLLLAGSVLGVSTFGVYHVSAQEFIADPEQTQVGIEVSTLNNESELNPLLYINSPEKYIHSTWHQKEDLEITWQVPPAVEAVAVSLTDDSDYEPRYLSESVYSPAIDSFLVKNEDLHSGTQFVNIQMKDMNGWSMVTSLQINIDEESPLPFSIIAVGGQKVSAQPAITFTAFDKDSGIDHYEVTIKTLSGQIINEYELPTSSDSSSLNLRDLDDGEYEVIVKAVDGVGNVTVSQKILRFDSRSETHLLTDKVLAPINLIVYGLSFLVLLQFLLYRREKLSQQKRENRLATETKDINQQIKRVFLALHEDVTEQVGQIRKNSRMTKKEIADNLAQSLEVSEILLNKEVEDVERILKENQR